MIVCAIHQCNQHASYNLYYVKSDMMHILIKELRVLVRCVKVLALGLGRLAWFALVRR